jgi:hypothetical protein
MLPLLPPFLNGKLFWPFLIYSFAMHLEIYIIYRYIVKHSSETYESKKPKLITIKKRSQELNLYVRLRCHNFCQ